MPDRKPTSLDGYTFFTIYRNQAIYSGSDTTPYAFAAGDSEKVWVFGHSYEKLEEQLDEIHGFKPAQQSKP